VAANLLDRRFEAPGPPITNSVVSPTQISWGTYWRGDFCRYEGGMALSRLRILVFPQTSKTWTARALEHDLSASANSAEAAIDTLLKIAGAHVAYDLRHGREPLSAFGAAPRLYWNAFDTSTKVPIPLALRWRESGTSIQVFAATTSQHPILQRFPSVRIA
jgi:hypothetical protein